VLPNEFFGRVSFGLFATKERKGTQKWKYFVIFAFWRSHGFRSSDLEHFLFK
jgi:hypothetical protein